MKGLGETSPFHRFTPRRDKSDLFLVMGPSPFIGLRSERDKSVYFWSWGSYLLYMYNSKEVSSSV